MATYFARKSGNINATDVWATTPSGVAGDVTFASGDVLMSNNFTIDVNVSVDLGASGQVRNDTTGGATAGGFFRLNNGVTLTASAFSNTLAVVQSVLTLGSSASFVGSLTQLSSGRGIDNASSGTLNVTLLGNLTGSSFVSASAIYNGNTGILNITSSGIFRGGTASVAAQNVSTGTLNFTGNVTGGSGAAALTNAQNGSIVLTGTATGGSGQAGITNSFTGTIRATRAVGNAYGPGNSVGLTAQVGISNSGLGIIEVEQLEYGTFGQSPTSGTGIRLKKANTNVAVFNYCDTAGAKTLIDATTNAAMPAANNVRSGVSYASGAVTGTCAVPAAGSVALGVPVDNTVGTAALTPADIWSYATRSITGGTVDTLTNAPASVTPADIWSHASRTLTSASGPTAVQIRQEMDSNSTKLANLDASVSSRLATSGYTAPTTPPTAAEITTAVWAAADKTGYSLTSSERSAIATAVESSILNEADGQAVLNAIVGAIGNSNVDEIALVAAIRSDLERNGGKLDNVPSAAASAVWGTATKTVTGGTVDTLTNAPSVPSAASIAAATRSELAVELARVDASVSSRMAASEATKLDAVKAKTDALPIERLQNCATTQIVGTLLAQANS